jgi:twinkle protein
MGSSTRIATTAAGELSMAEKTMGLTRRHGDLLEARGLDIELLEALGVSSSEKLGPDTIKIPYYRGDRIVGVKYRTISGEKKFTQEPGSAQILYNINCLSDQTLDHMPVVITEGEIDCWSALQAGFPRVVSVPAGAPSVQVADRASAKYEFLSGLPELAEKSSYILAVDSDDPGSALRSDMSLRLDPQRCKWVRYPKGCKDLNDALQSFGEAGVVQSIHRAQWMVGNVYRMTDIPPMAPAEPHISGFPGLSEHYRLRLGDFCVVSGVPGMGKTTFVNDLVCRMVMRHHWPACFASFEQIPQIDQRRALRTWFGGGLAKDLDAETLARADRWIDENFSFVVPGEDSYPTVPWVLDRFAASALRHGTRLFVLDPWNELEHDRPNGISLTEHVGTALRDMKAFARKYEAHLIVVAHPAKLKRENGQYPMPTLYDISDSAHWANKADIGIIVHRKSDDETIIKIAKSRYHDQIGKPGDVSVKYIWERATYELF